MKINLQIMDGNEQVQEFYEANGYSVEKRVSMGKRLPVDTGSAEQGHAADGLRPAALSTADGHRSAPSVRFPGLQKHCYDFHAARPLLSRQFRCSQLPQEGVS